MKFCSDIYWHMKYIWCYVLLELPKGGWCWWLITHSSYSQFWRNIRTILWYVSPFHPFDNIMAYMYTLHAVGPPTVFPLMYSCYAEQQYDEVLRVIDFATSVDVPVLKGDFNHGPAVPGETTWRLPFHYGLMNARGFYSPYILRDGRCTWCLENAQAAVFEQSNLIFDHIYITTNTMERVRSVEVRVVFMLLPVCV